MHSGFEVVASGCALGHVQRSAFLGHRLPALRARRPMRGHACRSTHGFVQASGGVWEVGATGLVFAPSVRMPLTVIHGAQLSVSIAHSPPRCRVRITTSDGRSFSRVAASSGPLVVKDEDHPS